jgi:16S rRNA (guanine1516-N2)-methyltransferase
VTGTGPSSVSVLYFHPQAAHLVVAFAGVFRLVEQSSPPRDHPGFHLWASVDHLELRRGDSAGAWVSEAELRRRTVQGATLLRACGVAGDAPLQVLDPLSGWGVDGLVLAGRGCRVTMVERQPALWALQQDLLRRSGLSATLHDPADGYTVLAAGGRYDVIYLDPMFPERGKGALPGKRMQWLAELTQPDPRPLRVWLEQALLAAVGRVVIKRRRKDAAVAPPDWRILGRSVRYDVYRGRASP